MGPGPGPHFVYVCVCVCDGHHLKEINTKKTFVSRDDKSKFSTRLCKGSIYSSEEFIKEFGRSVVILI